MLRRRGVLEWWKKQEKSQKRCERCKTEIGEEVALKLRKGGAKDWRDFYPAMIRKRTVCGKCFRKLSNDNRVRIKENLEIRENFAIVSEGGGDNGGG